MIPISVKIENDLPIKNTSIAIYSGPFVVDLPIQNGEIVQFATCKRLPESIWFQYLFIENDNH